MWASREIALSRSAYVGDGRECGLGQAAKDRESEKNKASQRTLSLHEPLRRDLKKTLPPAQARAHRQTACLESETP